MAEFREREKKELADPRRKPATAKEWMSMDPNLTTEELYWRRPLNPFDGGILICGPMELHKRK